ncbi:MAG: phenylalanine--tRNA ligase subunit beta [Oscillospiraceae bacterium]
MDLSLRWLSDYVETGVSPKEFCDAMTMSGSKVEGYSTEGDYLSNCVVGRIIKIEKHPDADKLQICQIDIGREEPVQIVTAATNVYEGMLVPAALDNSTLANGVKIKKGKLRGVVSNGMMCSLAELGLTVHDFPYAIEDGIMDIHEDCKPGDDIRDALGLNDTCVEFEITSNRPDCLSVIGLAREAAATFGKELHLPEPKVEHETGNINDLLSVEVKSPALCRRYVARMVKNIKIAPSPRWMRERLRASGVRPINNLVDITNYVMLEYGQPMHAFDYKYLKGGKIVVRNAEEGETITTLDGVERKLTPDMLVICDEEKPSCVAGVMGSEHSGIQDDTNTVVFESANFLGSSVRITAKKLGMRTEASGRYEKGLDSRACLPAVERACQLVEMLGAGEVVGGYIDVDNAGDEVCTIDFCPDWINRFLGIDLPAEKMVEILEKIGYKVENGVITVPSYRAGDTRHKADIAEEIARFYGYDVIPNTAVTGAAQGILTPEQKFEKKLTSLLRANGCYEVQTYSFISPKYYDKINLPEDSGLRRSVVITNPLGEDTSVMRTTCVPSMLEVISRNYNNRNLAGRFYEIGKIYLPRESADILPDERDIAVIGTYGDREDFFGIKGILAEALDKLGVVGVEYTAEKDNPTFHPGRCAAITIGNRRIGTIGEISPAVLANYGIETRAYVATVDMADIFASRDTERTFKPTPRFPASTRDLAIICDDELPAASLEKAIRAGAGKLLEKVQLFDVYKGASIAQGKKSVAYTMTLRAPDRTLTVEECDRAVNKVLKELANLGAQLRA